MVTALPQDSSSVIWEMQIRASLAGRKYFRQFSCSVVLPFKQRAADQLESALFSNRHLQMMRKCIFSCHTWVSR